MERERERKREREREREWRERAQARARERIFGKEPAVSDGPVYAQTVTQYMLNYIWNSRKTHATLPCLRDINDVPFTTLLSAQRVPRFRIAVRFFCVWVVRVHVPGLLALLRANVAHVPAVVASTLTPHSIFMFMLVFVQTFAPNRAGTDDAGRGTLS